MKGKLGNKLRTQCGKCYSIRSCVTELTPWCTGTAGKLNHVSAWETNTLALTSSAVLPDIVALF